MEKPSDENENTVVSRRSAITKGTAATIAAIATANGVSLNNNNKHTHTQYICIKHRL